MTITKIGIVNYGVGNIFSVVEACKKVGFAVEIIESPNQLDTVSGAILPGVGAFGSAVDALYKLDMFEALKTYALAGKPVLGICLGMQLLLDESLEFKVTKGLGLIRGKVICLKDLVPDKHNLKIPHIGWNSIRKNEIKILESPKSKALLEGINSEAEFYFVHSFAVVPEHSSVILAETKYDVCNFCSMVASENIMGVQFHPEKSGHEGLMLYKNWKKIVEENY